MEREDSLNDPERTGLAERERQDQEKAEVNRARQERQGVISEDSEANQEEPTEEEQQRQQQEAESQKSE